MVIKVLGPGCPKCVALDRMVRELVERGVVEATVVKVEDYPTIAGYGVMSSPALVVDEQVVLVGRVPKAAELARLIGSVAS